MNTQRCSRSRKSIVTRGLTALTLLSVVGCSKADSTMSYAEAPASGPADAEYAYGGPVVVDGLVAPTEMVEAEEQVADADEVAPAMDAPAPMRERDRAEGAAERTRSMALGKGKRADRRTKKDKARKSKPASVAPAGAMAGGAIAKQEAKVAKPVAPEPTMNTEAYDRIHENEFLAVADKPLSTFSIDVDTASYANTRRFLTEGRLPPADAVRVEEFINYFSYDYPQPTGEQPFSVTTEVSAAPWNKDAKLVHIGLQGKKLDDRDMPGRNLVFLLDVSGSMNSANKLPLLKQALAMLTAQLDGDDRVSVVVYAGASGVVLSPTAGNDKHRIMSALQQLRAGGSTNGGAGIELAYKLARQQFVEGGINRVILATDGDFNVGTTSRGELERLIEHERKSGVFLSVLGFGSGNVKDATMEMLADKGNGNYAYIDSVYEARKVLVEEAGSTLVTIAKDVKIQVEFNPAQVESYRLIGYENRKLADRDFNDDTKDAGEIGAGHTVTALYEVIPTGRGTKPGVDPLRYQKNSELTNAAKSGELMTLKLRYKQPEGSKSKLISFGVRDDDRALGQTSEAFRWSAAVASFGMKLRGSKFAGNATFATIHAMASGAMTHDQGGYKKQFLGLVNRAAQLSGEQGGLALAK
jgi:Ca-activated chloride channel family protein